MTVLGIDLGGTKIAAGRVHDGTQVDGAIVLETRGAEGVDRSLAQLWSAMDQAFDSSVQAIGIAAPGPLDPLTGVILDAPNMPGWRNIPLAQLAQERFGVRVRIENDCNAAALGEARFGAGRGQSIVFFAAIGTGIGAGIIINGELFQGAHRFGGEAGHLTIDYRSSTVCSCGARGCIEAVASGTAIARGISAKEGDDFVEKIAAWLGGIVSLLDPSIIILGGGVLSDARSEDWFERWRDLVPKNSINPCAASIPIVRPKFGAMTGVIGAAALFS